LPRNEPEALRLLLDSDVTVAAAPALRLRGFDVVSIRERGQESLPDAEVLLCAADQGRCLITYNARHFRGIHGMWLAESRHHSGIVVSKQLPIRQLLRRLQAFLNSFTPTQLADQLLWLPRV
jgi:hypothetical protein